MAKRCVLVILDGWGIGGDDDSNPIYMRQPKNINFIKANFLIGSLQASGIAVGLPWGEEGNSEVGHLTLGAGKTIYQHYPRITMAIHDGSFEKNKPILDAMEASVKNKKALNILGLLGGGVVHSSLEHLTALIKLAKKKSVETLNLHLFADGKDSAPRSVKEYLAKVEKVIKETGLGRVASLSGRYYAMDRDGRWEVVRRTYEVITGKSPATKDSIESIIEENYKKGFNDEFIEPTLVNPEGIVMPGDSIIFFDFREDSIRELAQAFTDENFDKFPVVKLAGSKIVTFTDYGGAVKSSVAFPPDKIDYTLGRVLSENELVQLRVAESEKYPHVTYFFNGLREAPYKNEYRVIIPSEKTPHHDEHPEMMSGEISDRLIKAVRDRGFDFILANFANPDIIAHSGNYDAALKTIDIIDQVIGKIAQVCLETGTPLIITSDHGNIEKMIDPITGRVETKHDPSPVPVYLVGKEFMRKNAAEAIRQSENQATGTLADVTPTILEILSLKKPESMTGESLIKTLNS